MKDLDKDEKVSIAGPKEALEFIATLAPAEKELLKNVLLKSSEEDSPVLAAMMRIKVLNIPLSSVIDVGASDGSWSNKVEKVWSDLRYLLIDANEHWEEKLKQRTFERPMMKYLIAAVGSEVGKAYFANTPGDPKSGHACAEKMGYTYSEVPSISLDQIVLDTNLPGPYFLKLDTHGFEVEIFSGAKSVLKNTQLIQVEAYNFSNRGRLRFHEMCAFLEERGFRCVDIVDVMRRAKDNILWQMDLFFIRSDREEFVK
ncbi:MAG: FkbM family methyltransferase [Thermodesulfobacteriota bacterium]